MFKRIVILSSAFGCAALGQTPPAAAISGMVVNAKGAGIAATVQLTGFGSSQSFGQVKSKADGSFVFSGLGAGTI